MNAIASIIKTIPVSPADIGTINSVRNRLAEIGEIDRRCRPDGPAWLSSFGFLHHEVDRLAAELAATPGLELAEQLHAAIARHRDAVHSIEPIAASLRHAAARILAELAPIIGKIFDAAAEKLAVEISARRAELAKGSVTLFDVQAELAAFDNRSVQLHAQLATEREAAAANPIQFLVSHIEPEVAPAPAPAPAPPPKNFRGKVKFTEPEPEAPTDVLSELADEDEIDLEDPLELLAGN
jgi:hypothetical protein